MPKENLPASVKMGGVETQVFRLSRGDASRNSLKDFVQGRREGGLFLILHTCHNDNNIGSRVTI